MRVEYLDVVDYLLIAEAVLDIPAETLARAARVELAESALHASAASWAGHDFYPTFPHKAAVLLSRLVKNHPLPDGNKRVAWISLRDFCARNGYNLVADHDDAHDMVSAVASTDPDETALAAWIEQRLQPAS